MSDFPCRATELLHELKSQGFTVRLVGPRLHISPAAIPPELVADIRAHRDAICALVRLRAEQPPLGVGSLGNLRALLPGFWRAVHMRDGRIGLLWGVHARGVMVSFAPEAPIVTVDASDIDLHATCKDM